MGASLCGVASGKLTLIMNSLQAGVRSIGIPEGLFPLSTSGKPSPARKRTKEWTGERTKKHEEPRREGEGHENSEGREGDRTLTET